ncbi:MAG: NADH-quinone oxidoreductase subunit NuoF, partial [Pseudomonas sp.]|uniref:NADH-quinone oxidoreductase subunit NuoF n=1 Tax=Pseudomonas sp. TaxID=306 RepID=UPI003D6FA03C
MTLTSFGPANRIKRSAETHPLTWRLRDDGEAVWLDEYQAKNGYAAARKAFADMAQDDIVQTVKDAGLKGRGGAGFPTGVKWGLMPKDESINIRYLLCNADEMEPNTWKDRMLMEQLPHLLIEGMLISARALKTYRGYIFLRGEYTTAAKHLNRAVEEAKAAGLLGKNILGSGFDFELFVHTGAGRYICGEETALINSLEGRRANPRSKPPFPAAVGVWGKPTCVNNVETLCNVPAIIADGVDWYKSLAREGSEDMGTKLMGFSGKVKNPGLWELPFGVTGRELFEDYAGGMRDGYKLKAWQPGGAGTGFLLPEHLDAQMYAGGIAKVGTRMGTGLAMAVDDSINM